jgi:cytochrome c
MTFRKKLLFVGLAQLVFVSTAFAQDRGTATEAKALAEKGLAYIKSAGMAPALDAFTNDTEGKWKVKDLYVFVNKFDGVTLAHGQNKTLVGKNTLGLKDATGKSFVAEFTELAKVKGHGWVSYQWFDKTTNRTLGKSTYVVSIPGQDALLGVGIYGAHNE